MTYTDPAPIGNAFGPGSDVVTCTRCGSLVLPVWVQAHDQWHEEQA
jgi:hypothetical protein